MVAGKDMTLGVQLNSTIQAWIPWPGT